MSKYYKAEDVIRAIEEMQNCYNGWSDTYDKAQIIGVLEELPTIEVSEDYISRADLLSELHKNIERVDIAEYVNDTVWRTIENAPSVTAEQSSMVDIVHCRDCKWWTKQSHSIQGRCELGGIYPTGEWFCANGERIEE